MISDIIISSKSVKFNKRTLHWINHNILHNNNGRNTKFHMSIAWLIVLLFSSLLVSIDTTRACTQCTLSTRALVCSIGIASHRLLNNGPIHEGVVAEDVVLPVSGPIHPICILLCSYLDCTCHINLFNIFLPTHQLTNLYVLLECLLDWNIAVFPNYSFVWTM